MKSIFEILGIQVKEKNIAEDSGSAPVSAIVACLGNPGREYLFTRHNAGFMCADMICEKLSERLTRSKFSSLCSDITYKDIRFLLMKPQTFMNNSGQAVREAAAFYKIPAQKIIVVSDDIMLDVGRIRIRSRGSDGGQKGLKSIIYQLQSDEFPRVRIGVGKKPSADYDTAAWVLADIPAGDRALFKDALSRAADAVFMLLEGKSQEAMNIYNG